MTTERVRIYLLLILTATLAACGGSSDDWEGDAPSGMVDNVRLDRELVGCRAMFAGGLPPAIADAPMLRGLCYEAFAIIHDGSTRTPKVVLQAIDRTSLTAAQGIQRTDYFFADARLPAAERAEPADYSWSGFDRGHLAPAADMPTDTAMAQSFSLANIVPQAPNHNRGPWAQAEAATRSYAMRAAGTVYVATGAVFAVDAPGIGPNQVRVPAQLFKLVHDPATGHSWAHWHANANETAMGPPISRDELVQQIGYDPMPGATVR